ncbi:MAG: hypothetical protein IPP45_09865 [Sphingomonadales bacterium]|nr:hypothetical protein [Sphingomonadales bacterium]
METVLMATAGHDGEGFEILQAEELIGRAQPCSGSKQPREAMHERTSWQDRSAKITKPAFPILQPEALERLEMNPNVFSTCRRDASEGCTSTARCSA